MGSAPMLRSRKTVAVVCIALVLCSAFLCAGAADIVWATLTPLWVVVPAVEITIVARAAFRCDESPAPLASLLPLRAPPRALPSV